MSGFIEIKTAELKGAALDWAMADAEGLRRKRVVDGRFGGKAVLIVNDGQRRPLGAGERYSTIETTKSWFGLVKETREIVLGWAYEPTLCWANLREYRVSLTAPQIDGGEWAAHLNGVTMRGDDIGPAICRVVVATRLGSSVSIPIELASG